MTSSRIFRSSYLGLTLASLFSLGASDARAQSVYAQAPAPERYAPPIDFAHTLVSAMMAESGTPGVSVAVGIDGQVVWSEGFGYADVENRTPVWAETKFRVGSVSKSLTAAALGLLHERGLLDLDAPVQNYVPSFPQKRWPVTTRQAAGHIAGIRHYNGPEFLSSRRYSTVLEGLEIFQNDTLLFKPGTRYSYSSYGWNLISAVVEGASGEGFLNFLREEVFEPLGMTHTVADHTDSIIPHRTRFYERTPDGRIVNASYVDNSYKWAGGGFLSAPEDLLAFAFAHLGDGFLKPETIDMLWTSQHTAGGEATGYGIGWFVAREDGLGALVWHGGGSVGGTTFLLIYPEQSAALAIVGNMTGAPVASAARLILDAFLEPDRLSATGPGVEVSGVYTCSANSGEEQVARATLEIGGPPTGYWGRVAWGRTPPGRIVFSSGDAEGTRLVAVRADGMLMGIRLSEVGTEGASGTWSVGGRGGALICARE